MCLQFGAIIKIKSNFPLLLIWFRKVSNFFFEHTDLKFFLFFRKKNYVILKIFKKCVPFNKNVFFTSPNATEIGKKEKALNHWTIAEHQWFWETLGPTISKRMAVVDSGDGCVYAKLKWLLVAAPGNLQLFQDFHNDYAVHGGSLPNPLFTSSAQFLPAKSRRWISSR